MRRNLFLTAANWSTLEKPSLCVGFQVMLVSEVTTVPTWLQNRPSVQQFQLWSVLPLSQCLNRLTLGYVNLSHHSRRDAVTLRRLCIGHTRFSHSYLLNREDQLPWCSFCDCALTVVHTSMLLECPHYNIVRQRYFSITTWLTPTLLWILLQILISYHRI